MWHTSVAMTAAVFVCTSVMLSSCRCKAVAPGVYLSAAFRWNPMLERLKIGFSLVCYQQCDGWFPSLQLCLSDDIWKGGRTRLTRLMATFPVATPTTAITWLWLASSGWPDQKAIDPQMKCLTAGPTFYPSKPDFTPPPLRRWVLTLAQHLRLRKDDIWLRPENEIQAPQTCNSERNVSSTPSKAKAVIPSNPLEELWSFSEQHKMPFWQHCKRQRNVNLSLWVAISMHVFFLLSFVPWGWRYRLDEIAQICIECNYTMVICADHFRSCDALFHWIILLNSPERPLSACQAFVLVHFTF